MQQEGAGRCRKQGEKSGECRFENISIVQDRNLRGRHSSEHRICPVRLFTSNFPEISDFVRHSFELLNIVLRKAKTIELWRKIGKSDDQKDTQNGEMDPVFREEALEIHKVWNVLVLFKGDEDNENVSHRVATSD